MAIDQAESRNKTIIRTSIIGIIANLFLAGFKAAIGIFSNSIAITLDAVNNLSDSLSSAITIIGTILSGKKPDKKHPMGYGRIEYLSAMVVSAIVLYAGLTSMVESVKKIIHPEAAEYKSVMLIIIAVAILVKIGLGLFVKSTGKRVHSNSLVASGSDALFDAILSASVLASAIVYMVSGVSLEAYVGALISIIIIKSGIEMMMETVDDILGKRADKEVTLKIKRMLNEEPEVRGAYDLVINNYGPNRNYASVHLELPDTMTVNEVDVLTRRVEEKVFKETGVALIGVGVYSFNTGNDKISAIRNTVTKTVVSHDWALQVHGFYVDLEEKKMRFDVVFSFDITPREGMAQLQKELNEIYPDYDIIISPDIDISD
ncbi:MAG: cation transporter [Lachnospiraceae bacterium]|nr:cation transporter [Lachnospiraceae bacterium]